MPEKLAIAVFAIVVGQLLSALAIIVLAFVAPDYMIIAMRIFGGLLAIRSAFFVIYGLISGNLSSERWHATRASQPGRFWSRLFGNLIGVGVGIFLLSLPVQ